MFVRRSGALLLLLAVGSAALAEEAGTDRKKCQVLDVLSGDTLMAQCGDEQLKLRLYCVEAPRPTQEPWGENSRLLLRKLAGKEVEVKEFPVPRSPPEARKERVIAELFQGGTSLNIEMVTQGQAAVPPRWCVEKRFLEAEAIAQTALAGIWSKPGPQQRPWELKERP